MKLLIVLPKFVLWIALFSLAACATTGSNGEVNIDPYEGFNRKIFGFNDGLDRYLVKPVTKGYQAITPNFIERGVSNFFSNLSEVGSLVNATLQGKPKQGAKYTGRFLVNSTLGVAGLFDVAKYMHLEKTDAEDFGQTLAVWGVDSGPYLVLPFLGPSTLRGGVSIPVDRALDPLTYYPEDDTLRLGLNALEIIDLRTRLLKAEELITGDRYLFLRDAYLQRREFLINDGKIEDNFGADKELDF